MPFIGGAFFVIMSDKYLYMIYIDLSFYEVIMNKEYIKKISVNLDKE